MSALRTKDFMEMSHSAAAMKASDISYENEQLQAKNAELAAEVERWKTISVCEACAELPAVAEYIEGMEKQLAIVEEHNARLIAALMKAAAHIRPTCDDLYYELKAIFTLPASRETLDKYVADAIELERTARQQAEALLHKQAETISVLTVQRDLAVEALHQAKNALCLPCDRWNKTQFQIIQNAIATIDAALSTIKESEV